MENYDKIISIIREKGPVIPAQIGTALGMNQLFSSAILSELVDSGKLRISSVKVGGSPLYYLPGQEEQLEKYHTNLPEKEQRTFNLLKERRMLADFELEPLFRVTIRQIKDFAKPLQVRVKDDLLIFWKWHLLPEAEAESLIRQKINEIYPDESPPPPAKQHPEPKGSESQSVLHSMGEKESIHKGSSPPIRQQKPKPHPATSHPSKDFMQKLDKYFEKSGITIIESAVIKKDSDIEFILSIPSPVGDLKYFCKAKNKQRCNDSDLSSAYVKGEVKKLPVLFITTGEFTKKAREALQNEFRNMKTQELG